MYDPFNGLLSYDFLDYHNEFKYQEIIYIIVFTDNDFSNTVLQFINFHLKYPVIIHIETKYHKFHK